MARYSCPKCASAMSVAEAFDGRCRISCRCGISCTMEMAGEINRTFLEFLRRYDSGEQLQDDAPDHMIRTEDELADIIGDANPDEIIRSILHTNQDYVCHYRYTDSPGPPPGGDIGKMGLNPALKSHLVDSGISGLYAFQEEAYVAITGGSDTAIVAPTASGKTEAFPCAHRPDGLGGQGRRLCLDHLPHKGAGSRPARQDMGDGPQCRGQVGRL